MIDRVSDRPSMHIPTHECVAPQTNVIDWLLGLGNLPGENGFGRAAHSTEAWTCRSMIQHSPS